MTVFSSKCFFFIYFFALGTTERCRSGLTTPVPAGFYLKDVWKSFVCNTQQFNSTQMGNCLKNKIVYMMGDSTTRQWFEYLERNVPGKLFSGLNNFDEVKQKSCYLRLDTINVIYYKLNYIHISQCNL